MIDRSKARDNPITPLAENAFNMLGTRAAETILASDQMRLHQQAAHMEASDPIKMSSHPLQEGAVHIWGNRGSELPRSAMAWMEVAVPR